MNQFASTIRYTPRVGEYTRGVTRKPEGCRYCPANKNIGFCYDYFPENPKIALLFPAPRKVDVIYPVARIDKRLISVLEEFGIDPLHDVAISHFIRCSPKVSRFDSRTFPSGPASKALQVCRRYDSVSGVSDEFRGLVTSGRGVTSWKPTHGLVTYSMHDFVKVPAMAHLISEDLRKACRMTSNGARFVVLFGREVSEAVFPDCFQPGAGGMKAWRGVPQTMERWPTSGLLGR